jgi:glutathione S-transferase
MSRSRTSRVVLCCLLRPPATATQPALQYTLHEVSFDELYGKPQWFKDLHPQGLIPVIAFQQAAPVPAPTAAAAPAGAVCIKESLVCNEYLEDAYPQPPVSCWLALLFGRCTRAVHPSV